MNQKTLVIHSGGLDSTVLLYSAISHVGKENVYTLSFNYGQKHVCELEQQAWHLKHLGMEDRHYEIDLSKVFVNVNSSALLKGSDMEIAHESYAEQLKHTDVVSAYVPYRNGLFLSVAASVAYQLECTRVAYGAHADDAVRRNNGEGTAAYPDCTTAFTRAQDTAIVEGTGGKVHLWAPFVKLSKADVVKVGIDAGMTREEFSHTHSCYEGVRGGCGTCGTCIDVRTAFDTWDHTRGIIQDGVKA